MTELGQALLGIGFLGAIFVAGYGARAAVSWFRRQRGSRGRSSGRLIYAGRRISDPSETDTAPAWRLSADEARLEADLERLAGHIEELNTVFTQEQTLWHDARGELASAVERFDVSVEQMRVLNTTLSERIEAAAHTQAEFEQMMGRLRRRGKDGREEAVLPFKFRQPRASGRK